MRNHDDKKKIGGSRIGGEPPIEYCCFDDETKDYLFFDFPMATESTADKMDVRHIFNSSFDCF